jgi:hypothetical protein
LAFVAGYGSDLFFLCLDKIVNAFVPAGGATTMTTTEITTGGITTVKKSAVAAHVAGDVLSDAAALHASRTPRGADGAGKRATLSTPRINHAPATASIDEEHP